MAHSDSAIYLLGQLTNFIREKKTMHDINKNRPEDGGIMLCLDNAKAFDRLQHAFLVEVLRAFKLPEDLINAVRTLYTEVQTRVKLNGRLCAPFPNTSGVKQGCPLSGILYVLVQEVQLYMIRSDIPGLKGYPHPRPGWRAPRSRRTPGIEGRHPYRARAGGRHDGRSSLPRLHTTPTKGPR